jgi:hypothetical protein
MTTTSKKLPKGWVAFVQGTKAQLISELKKDGKYYGQLTLISKPTESELLTELTRLKISLPA